MGTGPRTLLGDYVNKSGLDFHPGWWAASACHFSWSQWAGGTFQLQAQWRLSFLTRRAAFTPHEGPPQGPGRSWSLGTSPRMTFFSFLWRSLPWSCYTGLSCLSYDLRDSSNQSCSQMFELTLRECMQSLEEARNTSTTGRR